MMRRRQVEVFSISFLDLLSGALGAVIILYVAIPKKDGSNFKSTAESAERLVNNLKKKEMELLDLREQLERAKEKIELYKQQEKDESTVVVGKDVDVGFKFKGKEILFIIDTSFSMVEEDRMGQVKAGLKMLITSLGKEFKIDVIQYPNTHRAPFKTLWGRLEENTLINQMDIFDFIYRLRPSGGTPTRDVLLFALENYQGISDIVLLTDGAPTFHNKNKKDDIYEILEVVRKENNSKVQINCIGVGSEFTRDKTSDRYKFLSLLSQENDGFFVGF